MLSLTLLMLVTVLESMDVLDDGGRVSWSDTKTIGTLSVMLERAER